MIVISAGMPKSGSAWYFHLTNELLVAAGKQDHEVIREKYNLSSVLVNKNSLVRMLHFKNIWPLLIPHFGGNTFVVKTHAPPSHSLRWLHKMNIVKMTYIYRHPFDVVISAIDHGKRNKDHKTFGQCKDIETTIPFVMGWLDNWEKWIDYPGVFITKYEELVEHTGAELERLAQYLGLNVDTVTVHQIVSKYCDQESLLQNKMKGCVNFNKGIIARYKELLSEDEIELLSKHFGGYFTKRGYVYE